jgi:peptidoglycan/LPS O-acetylase OafA/YrhL
VDTRSSIWTIHPDHFFTNGWAAVVVFFVISGFALSVQLSTARPSWSSYVVFLVRRLIRLVPPMWASLVLGYVAFRVFGWPEDLGPLLFLKGLILQDYRINDVLWSLRVEIFASALFPLMLWLFQVQLKAVQIFTLTTLCVIPFFTFDSPVTYGFSYLFLFYLGICAGRLKGQLAKANSKLGISALVVGLCLLQASVIIPPFSSGLAKIIVGTGAFLVVLWVLAEAGGPATSLLRLPTVSWIGRISYSIFLFHFPIAILLRAITRRSPVIYFVFENHLLLYCGFFFLVLMALTLSVAMIAYRFIEAPCISLGRRISGDQYKGQSEALTPFV